MKKTIIVALILLATPALAKMEIERVYKEYDYAHAIVSYKNETGATYNMVRVKCKALTEDGKVVGVNTRSFYEHVVGKIVPGFEDIVDVPISLHGSDFSSVECSVSAR